MKSKSMVTMEEQSRFSQSLLWKIQREFYDERGVAAWSGDVPFYITSNPYIANCYANLVLRFIQDWVSLYPEAAKDPFYIIELGAGTGQFSFYVLKSLMHYLTHLDMGSIKIKYVMTDFTENNIRFWNKHHALQPYIKKNVLDFSVYDFENDTSITLINEKKTLSPGSIKNPLIVFANYLFDSVTSDIFSIANGEVKEGLLSLSTSKNNLKKGKLVDYTKLKFSYTDRLVQNNYYEDALFNKILLNYSRELNDSNILFPIGGLCGIKNLKSLANDRLMLISSDKGYTQIRELEDLDYPELDFHGSFSTMVNYHAISEYFKLQGGDSFLQTPRDALVTAVFTSGFSLDNMHEMRLSLNQLIEEMSPGDFFNFYELLVETHQEAKLNILTSYLNFSKWDPFIYEEISDRVESLLEDADDDLIHYLSKNIPKIAENFYFTPECHDTFFDVGVFFQTIEEYETAIDYFKLSEQYFGDDFALYFNYGLCHFYLDQYQASFENFKQADKLKPKNKEIKKWVTKLKKLSEKRKK